MRSACCRYFTVYGPRATESHGVIAMIARAFIGVAITYIVITQNWKLSVMLVLVFFIGLDHPPTRDDTVPLGWFRTCLGYASLLIPVLCFAPQIIR